MPFQTEAFVITEKNAPFVLEKIELDDPLEDEVLVEGTAKLELHTKSVGPKLKHDLCRD